VILENHLIPRALPVCNSASAETATIYTGTDDYGNWHFRDSKPAGAGAEEMHLKAPNSVHVDPGSAGNNRSGTVMYTASIDTVPGVSRTTVLKETLEEAELLIDGPIP
jgi:hypothetical protein